MLTATQQIADMGRLAYRKVADAEDALLERMQTKGKMDKGMAVAISKSRGWVRQNGKHLELTSKGKKPRDNAAAHMKSALLGADALRAHIKRKEETEVLQPPSPPSAMGSRQFFF